MIMEIISQRDIETQNQLLEALAERGVKSTQATLSRDIRDMRLIKELGPNGTYRYVMAASQDTADTDARLKKIFKECVLSYDLAQNILVIKTVSGMAMAVAAAVDAMKWHEVVGCIAGDDTIMCAIRTSEETSVVMEKIRRIVSKGVQE